MIYGLILACCRETVSITRENLGQTRPCLLIFLDLEISVQTMIQFVYYRRLFLDCPVFATP